MIIFRNLRTFLNSRTRHIVIVGTWLTPALIGWRKTKTQLKSHSIKRTNKNSLFISTITMVAKPYLTQCSSKR